MSEHTHPQSGHPFPHPVTLIHTDADDRPLVIPGHGPDFHLTVEDLLALARFVRVTHDWDRNLAVMGIAERIEADPDALRAWVEGRGFALVDAHIAEQERAERYRAERDAAIAGLKEARAMFANVRAALADIEGPSDG